MTKSKKLNFRPLTIRTLTPTQLERVDGRGPMTMNAWCSHSCSYSQHYCTRTLDGCDPASNGCE